MGWGGKSKNCTWNKQTSLSMNECKTDKTTRAENQKNLLGEKSVLIITYILVDFDYFVNILLDAVF